MEARTLVEVAPRDTIKDFQTGDTVRVNVMIREGDRQRIQAFEGVVLKGRYRQGDKPAPGATFIVRRVSYGVGVERTFLLCSPLIDSLEVTRQGKVRRARAYYLRGLTGRSARIKERR
ncbi:MAG: 50S ribosomal protein L19 [Dehalococcoidia bacterium]|jgi:large subunit ribosomal protein L19|nr:50S ribosomal protein L19 [Dehalococcoidia bacterium]